MGVQLTQQQQEAVVNRGGSLLFSAINGRDHTVVMGVTVVMALAVLATGILLDLVYGLVDARVGYGRV